MVLRGIVGGGGLLLVLVGGIFVGQGVGLIGGSYMTGRGRYAVIGGALVVVGLLLLLAARSTRRPGTPRR